MYLPSTVNFSNAASEQENLHTVSQVESGFFVCLFPPGGPFINLGTEQQNIFHCFLYQGKEELGGYNLETRYSLLQ